MGLSILWIILFHTSWYMWFPKAIELFQRSGNYGVDIFIFVSVYGLYYSMKKNIPLHQWYIRRIKRILPSFFIVATTLAILGNLSFHDYLKEISFTGFLFPIIKYEVVFWYIPAILIFYAFFPLVYKYRKNRIILLLVPVSFVFSNWFTHYIQGHDYSLFLCFFFMRIPIFLIGLLYADNEDKLFLLNKKYILVVIFLSFVCFLLLLASCNHMFVSQIPNQPLLYIIGSLPILCSLSFLLQYKIKIFNFFVLYCGKYSLQLYLIHVAYIYIIIHVDYFVNNFNLIFLFLIAIALAFPSAFALSKLENYLLGFIERK